MTALAWLRTDLRLTDQPALAAARAKGAAYALFIVSVQQWSDHPEAAIKQALWRALLKQLAPALAQRGVALKLLRVERWVDVPQALLKFCQAHGITEVHCNREQGLYERQRDRQSYQLLAGHGIELIGHDGQTLLAPGSVKTGSDATYRVFSPFARACRARIAKDPLVLAPDLDKARLPASMVPDEIDRVWPEALPVLPQQWPSTYEAIAQRLNDFLDNRVEQYDHARNFPAEPGTSQLSPYLAAGAVSVKQCLNLALQANHGELESGSVGLRSWINELIWREFYWHLLHGYPQLSMHRPLRVETERVRWREAPADFEAWCQARTGVPIVDAAMRELLSTGWMHNRLRMIVAMFLTKNLLIDWRKGERFFMQHLIDGELAANNGGWQWSASTGADAAPYFRVFNPISQSEKFDAQGRFISHWLPELAGLPAKQIHNPDPVERQARGYPQMIVDLKQSRLRAIEAFKQLA